MNFLISSLAEHIKCLFMHSGSSGDGRRFAPPSWICHWADCVSRTTMTAITFWLNYSLESPNF